MAVFFVGLSFFFFLFLAGDRDLDLDLDQDRTRLDLEGDLDQDLFLPGLLLSCPPLMSLGGGEDGLTLALLLLLIMFLTSYRGRSVRPWPLPPGQELSLLSSPLWLLSRRRFRSLRRSLLRSSPEGGR